MWSTTEPENADPRVPQEKAMTSFLALLFVSSFVSSGLVTPAAAQIAEVARLVPDGLAEGDRLGLVALSGDRAIVGSPFVSTRGTDSGAAFVFERSALGEWAVVAKLHGSQSGEGAYFGSVDMNGNLAVVGAFGEHDLGFLTGAAYVFERVHGEWHERARLAPEDAHMSQAFGVRVAVHGKRIFVAATGDDEHGFNSGAVYVFERDAATHWVQVGKLVPADTGIGDYFGSALALDHDRALIGALSDEGASASGSAYVYERRPDGSWSQVAKLVSPRPTREDYFGSSLALSGKRALVGAHLDDSAGYGSGAAYLFEREARGAWVERARLTPGDAVSAEQFGCWVALSGDRALAGALGADAPGNASGAAYLFERDAAGQWREIEKLTASDGAPLSHFGHSVALDGERALIAAPRADGSFLDTGAVYVFEPARRRRVALR